MAICDNAITTQMIDRFKLDMSYIRKFSDSSGDTATTPDGEVQLTITGIIGAGQDAIDTIGYNYLDPDTFETGATLTTNSDALRWDSNGEYYRWAGALPKEVPAGSTPSSTGGIGDNTWRAVGSGSLQESLAGQGAGKGVDLVNGADFNAESLINLLDVPFVDGKFYSNGGFYPDTVVGGGRWKAVASEPYANFNGGTVVTIPALEAWRDAAIAAGGLTKQNLIDNLNVFLDWTGTGTGAFVRISVKEIRASWFAEIAIQSDQSSRLQKAWEAAYNYDVPFIVDGEYWVYPQPYNDPDIPNTQSNGLIAVSGTTVKFKQGSSIKCLPTNLASYNLIQFFNRENIVMMYPELHGDRQTNTSDPSNQFGHCFNIVNCENVYIHKPKAYNAWGDGYYIGLQFFSSLERQLKGVTLFEPFSDLCSRNGISLCSGHDVRIVRPVNKRVNRVDPRAGIDIEPEFGADNANIFPSLKNVIIESPESEGCISGLLAFIVKDTMDYCDVSITGTLKDYNSNTALQMAKRAIPAIGSINIESVKAISNISQIFIDWVDDGGVEFSIDNVEVIDGNRNNTSGFNNAMVIKGDSTNINFGGWRINNFNLNSPNINKYIDFQGTGYTLDNVYCKFNFTLGTSPVVYTSGSDPTLEPGFVLNALARSSFFQQNGDFYPITNIEFLPSTADNITYTLSTRVKSRQKISKDNATIYSLVIEPPAGGSIIDGPNTYSTSFSSSTPGAFVELKDNGSGDRLVVNKFGTWSGS